MIRLSLLMCCGVVGLSVWGEPSQEQSATVREIQQLDQSHLDFDFFEESATNEELSDEESLLQALELLEQSQTTSDPSQVNPVDGIFEDAQNQDAFALPDDMDEEVDASLDQALGEELLEDFEDQFNEEEYEDLQDEFEDDAESFIEDQLEFFDED